MTGPAAAARAHAAQAVEAIRAGRALESALQHQFAALPPALARERALIQEMTYGTVRWLLQLEPLIHERLEKPLKAKDHDIESLLLVGLYQLLHMQVAAHAAVKETVEAAAILKKEWAKGLVNALLRRVLREQEAIRARLAQDEQRAHPEWLLTRLRQAYPQDWRAIADANNARPPLTLRVHLGRTTRAACQARLQQAGIEARALPEVESALILDNPVPVELLPGFREGEMSVQDAAAQLAAPLLDCPPGGRVLDACAAPGGKAAHLLERDSRLELVALDVESARLEPVRENFVRLGLRAAILQGDATHPEDWWDGQPFDRILLDAPCSATGVIRRHPDIRLHRTPRDVERLVAAQARLLDRLWPLLAAGGKLLYVTCSILPEENRQQTEAFLARQPQARAETLVHPALARHARADGAGWQILPGAGDMDGFYYACLVRNPDGV